jgi:hypothetical protein
MDGHDDPLAGIQELLGNRAEVFPVGLPTAQVLPHRVVSLPWGLLNWVPDDLGIGFGQSFLEVARDVGLDGSPHDLHVLPRHRPPSITPRRVGVNPNAVVALPQGRTPQ